MNPLPEQMGVWVVCALALWPVIKEWLPSRRKEKREVSFESVYATTTELGAVRDELTQEINRVDSDVQALKDSIVSNGEKRRIAIESKVEAARTEARQEAGKLHDKINDVDKAVTGLQTGQDLQRQILAQISAKLDRKP